MTLDHNIRLAYINTVLDGGYTRLADGTTNPPEGYIVGGVTEPTTMDLHTDKLKDLSVLTIAEFQEFKGLWRTYDMQLDECVAPNIGVGTWIHEGKIYFDLVQHIHDLDVATKMAKEREEIAIYDCANLKDITL
tara:strand:+ start:32 stop:433 length:402 start_codon:yes stop_codon:yes gene_type:complete